MHQRIRQIAFLTSGALVVCAGIFAAACGTDNGTTETPLPTPEAGRDTGSSGGNGDSGPNPEEDAGLDASNADCGLAPKLRDNTNGFFCPFQRPQDGGADGGDGGSGIGPCTNNQSCCNPNRVGGQFPPSFCANGRDDDSCANGAAAANSDWSAGGSQWECADGTNCPGMQVCCLITGPDAGGNVNIGNTTDQDIPKACGALQAFKFGGTRCQAQCAAGTEIRLCSSNDDHCQGSTKCTPFRALSRDLAYCR